MDLYSEIILDLNKNPKNFREIKDSLIADATNSLCGDSFKVYALVEENIIVDIAFKGVGCAISKASASLMTESLKGLSVEKAKEVIEHVRKMARGEEYDKELVGKISFMSNIKKYPSRVKCLTLCWNGAKNILNSEKI